MKLRKLTKYFLVVRQTVLKECHTFKANLFRLLCAACSTDTHSEQIDVPLCVWLHSDCCSLLMHLQKYSTPFGEEREAVHKSVYSVLCAGLHVTMSFFVQHACHFLLRLVPPCVLIAAHPNVFNALINLMATKREHCERERETCWALQDLLLKNSRLSVVFSPWLPNSALPSHKGFSKARLLLTQLKTSTVRADPARAALQES